MAYYRGKDIEKSGGNAMQEVILEKRSIAQVARRFEKTQNSSIVSLIVLLDTIIMIELI